MATLATIETAQGTIELDSETGRWKGDKSLAMFANTVATIQGATPDVGHPVRWVVDKVNELLSGNVTMQEMKHHEPTDDRVY